MLGLRLLSGQSHESVNGLVHSPLYSQSAPSLTRRLPIQQINPTKQKSSLDQAPLHIRGVVKLQAMMRKTHIRAQELIRLALKTHQADLIRQKTKAATTNKVRSGYWLSGDRIDMKETVHQNICLAVNMAVKCAAMFCVYFQDISCTWDVLLNECRRLGWRPTPQEAEATRSFIDRNSDGTV
jgi:hypothetical protein